MVVKNQQKSMFEFNLESVFLSHFFKKKFYFADFPEDTLKTCPISTSLLDGVFKHVAGMDLMQLNQKA